MRLRDRIMELMACLVLIGLSVVGVVSVFVTGLRHDIDGLLLILVCVLMFSIFSTLLFVLAKQEGWLARPRGRDGAAAASDESFPRSSKWAEPDHISAVHHRL
jgi:hypothetical protein